MVVMPGVALVPVFNMAPFAAAPLVATPNRHLQQQQASESKVSVTLKTIQILLGDRVARTSLIHDLVPDGRLEEKHMNAVGEMLGKRTNILPEKFGNLGDLFYRFDFKDAGFLGNEELDRFLIFVLRQQRERLSSINDDTKVCDLPRKNLREAYNIFEQLGQGGQGEVYLAEERATGTKRVVKFHSKAFASGPMDDIKEEVMLLKSLDHPSIARICEAFEDDTHVYVVSEPYFGGDLTKMMTTAREKLGVESVTYRWVGLVLKQVLEAVAFLHSKMVMHCDLKEANIMMAHKSEWRAPSVVIIDFGLAKDFCCKGFDEAPGGGTPGYMPPEVWEKELWTAKGDMFALAATFWGIFNGRQGGPFLDEEHNVRKIRYNTLYKAMDCSIVAVPALRELMLGMAEKDFKKRPTARQALRNSFFHIDPSRSADERTTLCPRAIDEMENAMRRKSTHNMLAMHLMVNENVHQLAELNKLFRFFDKNGDGVITEAEARKAFEQAGLPECTATKFIAALGGEGTVPYSEFIGRLLVSQKDLKPGELAELFNAIDANGDGFLSTDEIAQLLANPVVAGLMDGRSAEDLVREMDINGDGKIDFAEFERAMRGEERPALDFCAGDRVEYKSKTLGRWVECKVMAVDPKSSRLRISAKPDIWLYPEEARALLRHTVQSPLSAGSAVPPTHSPAAHAAQTQMAGNGPVRPLDRGWAVGDSGRYWSKTQQAWIDCVVSHTGSMGRVMLDVKPDSWLSTEQQKELLRCCWAVGDPALYFSKTAGGRWLQCEIVNISDALDVKVNVKPDVWITLHEQHLLMRL